MGDDHAELWQQIRPIVSGALERPAAGRERWVRDACREEPGKAEFVLRLLDLTQALGETTTIARVPQAVSRPDRSRFAPNATLNGTRASFCGGIGSQWRPLSAW